MALPARIRKNLFPFQHGPILLERILGDFLVWGIGQVGFVSCHSRLPIALQQMGMP